MINNIMINNKYLHNYSYKYIYMTISTLFSFIIDLIEYFDGVEFR